ncbi:hypothetical protein BC830DRAFT_34779 [Chytriomyces sp. MP71]|nr:hypothetical protein BC830DRAFT_34779 [Chytriomyces sp. MP71]
MTETSPPQEDEEFFPGPPHLVRPVPAAFSSPGFRSRSTSASSSHASNASHASRSPPRARLTMPNTPAKPPLSAATIVFRAASGPTSLSPMPPLPSDPALAHVASPLDIDAPNSLVPPTTPTRTPLSNISLFNAVSASAPSFVLRKHVAHPQVKAPLSASDKAASAFKRPFPIDLNAFDQSRKLMGTEDVRLLEGEPGHEALSLSFATSLSHNSSPEDDDDDDSVASLIASSPSRFGLSAFGSASKVYPSTPVKKRDILGCLVTPNGESRNTNNMFGPPSISIHRKSSTPSASPFVASNPHHVGSPFLSPWSKGKPIMPSSSESNDIFVASPSFARDSSAVVQQRPFTYLSRIFLPEVDDDDMDDGYNGLNLIEDTDTLMHEDENLDLERATPTAEMYRTRQSLSTRSEYLMTISRNIIKSCIGSVEAVLRTFLKSSDYNAIRPIQRMPLVLP